MIPMKIIIKLKEIEDLESKQPELEQLLEAIEEYFCELFDIFGDDSWIEEFRLDKEAGHIVIIENEDDAFSLEPAGIGELGLKDSCPEAIERIMLKDGKTAYKISICTNNSYMVTLFSIEGTLDAETEAWLQNNSVNEKNKPETAAALEIF